jgi:hypothetical protein
MCLVEAATDRRCELAGERQPASHPSRNHTLTIRGAPNPGAHIAHAHELECLAGECETIPGAQPRNERLLDRSQTLSTKVLNGDLRIANDRSNRHPMPTRDLTVGHDPPAVALHDPGVVLVSLQRIATARDEIHHPLPLGVAELRVCACRPHFAKHFIGDEASTERYRDHVLHQQVERTLDGKPRLDRTGLDPIARGGDIDELEHVGRHAGHPAQRAGTMAASPCPLQQTRHALGAPDLQHAIDRREVDAKVEARCRDHTSQTAGAQPLFDPLARLSLE